MAEREKPHLIRVREVGSDGKPGPIKTVRADQLRDDGPRRSPLTTEQRKRAEGLHPKVQRMYSVSMGK